MANQFAERIDTERLAVRLERLTHEMRQAGDTVNADKLLQLSAKARDGEIAVAFCVHFSSAKSTMINTLLGKELLPSNPIPTSANVVKIRAGEPAARVYTHHSGVLSFDPDTEMEALKQYAVDGDTVEWVEIAYPGLFMGEKASLLDTPGIDSTDAAHKIATESALHLADVVVITCHFQRGMTNKDGLKGKNIPAVHQEEFGHGMPENMGGTVHPGNPRLYHVAFDHLHDSPAQETFFFPGDPKIFRFP